MFQNPQYTFQIYEKVLPVLGDYSLISIWLQTSLEGIQQNWSSCYGLSRHHLDRKVHHLVEACNLPSSCMHLIMDRNRSSMKIMIDPLNGTSLIRIVSTYHSCLKVSCFKKNCLFILVEFIAPLLLNFLYCFLQLKNSCKNIILQKSWESTFLITCYFYY